MFSANTNFVPSPVGSKRNHEDIEYDWVNLNFDDEDGSNNYDTSLDDILAPLVPIEEAWGPPTSEVSTAPAGLRVSGLNVRIPSPITVPPKSKEPLFKPFQKEPVAKSSYPSDKKEPKRAILNLKKAPKPPSAKAERALKRRPRQIWSLQEDTSLLGLLKSVIADAKQKGSDCSDLKVNWSNIAVRMKTTRTPKQCRDRWQNYLRPGIKKGNWTESEEQQIADLYSEMGPKWSTMASLLPQRSENDIKNKWYSMLRKKERARINESRVPFESSIKPTGAKNTGFAETAKNKKSSSTGIRRVRFADEIDKPHGGLEPFATVKVTHGDIIRPAVVESRPVANDTKLATLDGFAGKTDGSAFSVNFCGDKYVHQEDTKMHAQVKTPAGHDDDQDFEPLFVGKRYGFEDADETMEPSA